MANDRTKIENFAERFNQLLIDRQWDRLTDKELSKKLDKSNTTIWNWRNAIKLPSLDTAIDLANAFDVCVEWLLTGRGPQHPGNGNGTDGTLYIKDLPEGQQTHLRALVHSIRDESLVRQKG